MWNIVHVHSKNLKNRLYLTWWVDGRVAGGEGATLDGDLVLGDGEEVEDDRHQGGEEADDHVEGARLRCDPGLFGADQVYLEGEEVLEVKGDYEDDGGDQGQEGTIVVAQPRHQLAVDEVGRVTTGEWNYDNIKSHKVLSVSR